LRVEANERRWHWSQGRLSDRKKESEPAVPSRGAPGDFIFVSGQVAKDADGNMIVGTIEEETRGTIEAIRRILAEEGATLSDVVRVTTYLEDARDFGRYNRVFAEQFKDAVLARTTVEARAVISTRIEMDAIAYKPRT
jgi:2-iminobutanoate/2-iminopropanoate deaminase